MTNPPPMTDDLVGRLRSYADTCTGLEPRRIIMDAADHIADAGKLVARVEVLEAALASAISHLMNAKIDLETGCPKRVAIATIEGGIRMARVAQHLKQEDVNG